MNHRFLRLALPAMLAALPAATLSFTPQAHGKPSRKAQASTRRTVLDYFKLLPRKYTELNGLPSHVIENDEANDYLEAGFGDVVLSLNVALFRHAGRVLVAVQTDGIANSLDLLRYENGRWKNVTKAMVPGYNPHHIYEVPRRGTTIRVFDNTDQTGGSSIEPGKHLHDLLWRGGKFSIR